MSLDLDALMSRLADVVADRLRPIVADAVKAAVATKAEPRIYFAPELGKRLGKTPDAFRMYLKRGGYELAALAIDIGGRQAWRADDVEAYLSQNSGVSCVPLMPRRPLSAKKPVALSPGLKVTATSPIGRWSPSP